MNETFHKAWIPKPATNTAFCYLTQRGYWAGAYSARDREGDLQDYLLTNAPPETLAEARAAGIAHASTMIPNGPTAWKDRPLYRSIERVTPGAFARSEYERWKNGRLTVTETAARLGIDPSLVRRYIREQRLPAECVQEARGPVYYVRAEDADQFTRNPRGRPVKPTG